MTKRLSKIAFITGVFVLITCAALNAQVTIGADKEPQSFSVLELISNDKGLRLPQVTTGKRNDITDAAFKANGLAKGLTIFNTTTNCLEYWNDTKWISLCLGQAEITFTNAGGTAVDPAQPPFSSDGEERGPFTPHDNPDCNTQNPAYTFDVMTGSDYLFINVLDESTGQFKVEMLENETALLRTAIVRITNNCTKEYKEFLFSQEGDDTNCATNPVPSIKSEKNSVTDICAGGAVYLYLEGRPSGDFIWTLNNTEVGRDNWYVATKSGKYVVYGGKIGCPNSQSITVTVSSNPAPMPVSVIVGQNNGYICSAQDSVYIFATEPAEGNIVWYKNGERTSKKTKVIRAGEGTWFAVVENGNCSSVPSNSIEIKVDGGTPTSPPNFTVNGSAATDNITVCAGGTLLLDVVNPDNNLTYEWWFNNSKKSEGIHYEFDITGVTGDFILQCRATGISVCSQSTPTQITLSSEAAPAVPLISNPSSGQYLCGGTATLTASGGAAAYRWYKDGVYMGDTHSTSTLVVDASGTYSVRAISSSGCSSNESAGFVINGVSAYGTALIKDNGTTISGSTTPIEVEQNTSLAITGVINPSGHEKFEWSVTNNTNGAVVLTGSGQTVILNFPQVGQGTVTLTASNACTPSATAAVTFDVKPSCKTPDKTGFGYMPASKAVTIVKGKSTTLTVTPSGNPSDFTYRWYSTELSGYVPNATSQNISVSPAANAKYRCDITAACGSSEVQSEFFNVTVLDAGAYSAAGGALSLSGAVCFDTKETDNLNGNGTLASRNSMNNKPTGTSVYTLTAAGTGNTITSVDFWSIEPSSADLIESYAISGTPSVGNVATLTWAEISKIHNVVPNSVQNGQRITIKVYATVNGSAKRYAEKVVKIQDFMCCGAKVSANEWKAFECHNLGANVNLDPFTPAAGIHGAKYKWGTGVEAMNQATDQYYSGANKPKKWSDLGGTPPTTTADWNMVTKNPCPVGYVVPTKEQWAGVIKNNTWKNAGTNWTYSETNYATGAKVGDWLFLPAAGGRYRIQTDTQVHDGKLYGRGSHGRYWSTSSTNTTQAGHMCFSYTTSGGVAPSMVTSSEKDFGYPIRCIAE